MKRYRVTFEIGGTYLLSGRTYVEETVGRLNKKSIRCEIRSCQDCIDTENGDAKISHVKIEDITPPKSPKTGKK